MADAAESKYAAEQKALRKKTDGAAPLREQLRTPEINPEVYKDVLPLLFRGFLTAPAAIGSTRFVFKTLNHHEFEQLKWFGWEGSPRFWDYFLAYSVLFVDGKNVLRDRDTWVDPIAKTFREMQRGAQQKMIRHLSELNRRAADAVTLTEAYALETYSRFRWGQIQGIDLCHPSVTGIAGTETLGLNWSQLIWRSLNYYEDITVQVERDWENAKFIGACFAGKGVQKIYNQDNDRRRKEHEERLSRKERLIRHVFEGTPLDSGSSQGGRPAAKAKNIEELADELEKGLRGEKDFHDRVIEAWENKTRQQVEDRRQHIRELMERNEALFEGRSIMGGTRIEGLSPEEVRSRMARRKQLEGQAQARMIVYPELNDPKMAGFLEKRYPENPSSESRVVPLVPQREVGTPFRGDPTK